MGDISRSMGAGDSKALRSKVFLDLILMMFNLRDIRGEYGRGERALSYWMFFQLFKTRPKTMCIFLTELPNYGAWFDLNNLYEMTCLDDRGLTSEQRVLLKDSIAKTYAIQLRKDISSPDTSEKSLAAKWVPKEGRSLDKKTRMAKHIAKLLYADQWASDMSTGRSSTMRLYRNDISKLTAKLDVTERKMSAKDSQWKKIDFKKMPGRCMAKRTKAWQNLDKKGGKRTTDPDRVACAENYSSYLGDLASGKTTAKGRTLFVHELAKKLADGVNDNGCMMSTADRILFESMMDSHVDSIAASAKEKGNANLGNTAVMADVSGSMDGDPMSVAYALAVVASHPKIAHPAWANIVMTFSDNPEWIRLQYPDTHREYVATKFESLSGLRWNAHEAGRQLTWSEKLRIVKSMPWGCSTDFIGALNLIATRALEAGVDMPNFICISDMQWNAAAHNAYSGRAYGRPALSEPLTHGPLYNFSCDKSTVGSQPTTVLRQVKKRLVSQGLVNDFTTILWNVRGGVSGHAGGADETGFVEVAGFSTNMLRVFLNEGTLEAPTGSSSEATSWSTLRAMLDHENYDRIREIANLVRPWRDVDKRPLNRAELTLLPPTELIPPMPPLVRRPCPNAAAFASSTTPCSPIAHGAEAHTTVPESSAQSWSYTVQYSDEHSGGASAATSLPTSSSWDYSAPRSERVGTGDSSWPPLPLNAPRAQATSGFFTAAGNPVPVPSATPSAVSSVKALEARMDAMEKKSTNDMADLKSMMSQLLQR
jgi:hypothetical protein